MNDLVLAQAAGPPSYAPLIMLAVIFGIFYFLVIRPQQQQQRDKEQFRKDLKKNDEVITAGGLFGRVVDLKGTVVVLEIAQNVRIRIDRRSIEGPAATAKKGEAKESEK